MSSSDQFGSMVRCVFRIDSPSRLSL
jgi:hypothetical protein